MRPAASACITFTTIRRSRKAGAATIAADIPNPCCRPSTIRPERFGIRSGVLSTAGNLIFAGDPANNFVALNAATGEPLWHANLGSSLSNGPITYELDGTQYLVAAAGDTLFGFIIWGK